MREQIATSTSGWRIWNIHLSATRHRPPLHTPYSVAVPARRTKHLRFNDLENPSIPRDTDYASVIESDVPIVVQHTRLDSRQPANGLLSTIAFSERTWAMGVSVWATARDKVGMGLVWRWKHASGCKTVEASTVHIDCEVSICCRDFVWLSRMMEWSESQ